MQLWRICKSRYASTAYSGEGSKLWPGRWHNYAPMVYTATSIALASVEVFVNLNRDAEPEDMVCIEANIPDDLIQDVELDSARLQREEPESTQRLGMQWLAQRKSVGLRVPSIAVMRDWNVLLNPEHPAFSHIAIEEPWAFRFDPRMFRHA